MKTASLVKRQCQVNPVESYSAQSVQKNGPDFPGETFRLLKEKEIRQYGEYRTKMLVMEAWGRLGHE